MKNDELHITEKDFDHVTIGRNYLGNLYIQYEPSKLSKYTVTENWTYLPNSWFPEIKKSESKKFTIAFRIKIHD